MLLSPWAHVIISLVKFLFFYTWTFTNIWYVNKKHGTWPFNITENFGCLSSLNHPYSIYLKWKTQNKIIFKYWSRPSKSRPTLVSGNINGPIVQETPVDQAYDNLKTAVYQKKFRLQVFGQQVIWQLNVLNNSKNAKFCAIVFDCYLHWSHVQFAHFIPQFFISCRTLIHMQWMFEFYLVSVSLVTGIYNLYNWI